MLNCIGCVLLINMLLNISLFLLLFLPLTLQAQGVDALQTRPEATNFEETSRYADVVAFLEAVDVARCRVVFTSFGPCPLGA